MPHCDDDELAVIALGETARPEDVEHLASCAQCRSRLDELAAVVTVARTVTHQDLPQEPPDFVWSAISDELAPTATVTEMRPRSTRAERPQRWLLPAAAAVLGVVVGGAGVALLMGQDAPADIVAEAELEPIDYAGITGTASIERSATGATLTVSVPDLPAAEDGYYEVWMATPDTATMVAIGTLNAGETETYPLPEGMSASDFPVVDVSLEHFDGDAGHSATSVVRGTLLG